MTNQTWFVVPAVLILLYLLKTAGSRQAATVRKGAVVFGPSREATFTVVGGVLLGAALVAGPKLQAGRFDPITMAIGIALVAGGISLAPSVIIVTPERVEAKWWWGKRTVLPWRLAEAAWYDATKQQTFVYGSDGTAIKHTRAHVDAPRFRSEVAERVKQFDGLKPSV